MHRIALVEDHSRLAELIRQALGGAGIGADVFHNLESAWLAVREINYGALVIDRGLPDGDGLQLVKRLRTHHNAIPCLMMTARDALHDRVDGLDSGADDYLTKPFPMEELIARVRALLRRPALMQTHHPAYLDVPHLPGCLSDCYPFDVAAHAQTAECFVGGGATHHTADTGR
jgi:DNA-binding response OmpR family regulator